MLVAHVRSLLPLGPPFAAEPQSSRRWWTLAVVALAQLMVVLDATIVNIALPSAQADLGFTDNDRQWVVTAYALAFGSLLLLGGRLSDMFGRSGMFLIGLVGFAVASALGGAAQSFELLVGARALQGAFARAPRARRPLRADHDLHHPQGARPRVRRLRRDRRRRAAPIGLLLGGFLTENFDWRWNLYVNVVIAVVAVVGAVLFVDRLERTGPRPTRRARHAARLRRPVRPGLRLLAGRDRGLGRAR